MNVHSLILLIAPYPYFKRLIKDDVKEVASGYDCGLNINNYNDVKEGDMVEAFEEIEVSKKL